MSNLHSHPRLGLGMMLALLVAAGCDNSTDTNRNRMVTISGTVLNVDTAEPAAGVRVTLFDTEYTDDVATGDDGAFIIEIPSGSQLVLLTDDFDSNDEAWVPQINYDLPLFTVTGDVSNWITHACPYTQAPEAGSVALLDHYLQNADDQIHGDRFVPTSLAESGGVIIALFFWCPFGNAQGMRIETDTSAFPVAYRNMDYLESTDLHVFHPDTVSVTEWVGAAISAGDPGYTGETVTLTITDTVTTRGYDFTSPYEVPVRPGTVTAIWAPIVEGESNATVGDVVRCWGAAQTQGRRILWQ